MEADWLIILAYRCKVIGNYLGRLNSREVVLHMVGKSERNCCNFPGSDTELTECSVTRTSVATPDIILNFIFIFLCFRFELCIISNFSVQNILDFSPYVHIPSVICV